MYPLFKFQNNKNAYTTKVRLGSPPKENIFFENFEVTLTEKVKFLLFSLIIDLLDVQF